MTTQAVHCKGLKNLVAQSTQKPGISSYTIKSTPSDGVSELKSHMKTVTYNETQEDLGVDGNVLVTSERDVSHSQSLVHAYRKRSDDIDLGSASAGCLCPPTSENY